MGFHTLDCHKRLKAKIVLTWTWKPDKKTLISQWFLCFTQMQTIRFKHGLLDHKCGQVKVPSIFTINPAISSTDVNVSVNSEQNHQNIHVTCVAKSCNIAPREFEILHDIQQRKYLLIIGYLFLRIQMHYCKLKHWFTLIYKSIIKGLKFIKKGCNNIFSSKLVSRIRQLS